MQHIELSDQNVVPLTNIAPNVKGLRILFVNVFVLSDHGKALIEADEFELCRGPDGKERCPIDGQQQKARSRNTKGRKPTMGAPAITMDVRRVGEKTAVVDIRGEVTAACEPVLMSAYEAAGGGATSRLVLNFAGLEYMNSGGIGMLVTLLVRANRQHQELAAYGLSEHYREIFELTRLDEAITIYDSEESALNGVVR